MQFLTGFQNQVITGQVVKRTPRGKYIISVGGGNVIASGPLNISIGEGVTLLSVGRSHQILSSFVTSYGRSVREIFVKM